MSIVTYNNRSIANISAIPGAAKSLIHIKTLTASSSSTLDFVDGSSDVFKVNHTYNKTQIDWFKAGSALNLIKQQNH